MSDIATKLRIEIQEGKKMRHEFVLRKFSFLTVLLGGGSLTNKIPTGSNINLSWLLLLMPVVAIAFDLYILTEDYRIKRAGEFIRKKGNEIEKDEKEWEEFSKQHPNILSTLAFSFVTLIYLIGAAIILFHNKDQKILDESDLWLWVYFMFFVEIILVLISVLTRKWIEIFGTLRVFIKWIINNFVGEKIKFGEFYDKYTHARNNKH